MRSSRLLVIIFIVAPLLIAGSSSGAQRQPVKRPGGLPAKFRENGCVSCHAGITEPLAMSAHFYQWRGSGHEKAGIGCEKCHGGDPRAKVAEEAHRGVAAPGFPASTLHRRNQAVTCGECHQEVTAAFVESAHYRKLTNSAEAPSCTTCHGHMASEVIYWPPATAKLCAGCHQMSAIPLQAQDLVSAFARADEVVEWTRFLIASNPAQRARLRAEGEELVRLGVRLDEAKREFHRFSLDSSRRGADRVFNDGYRLKESVWEKLPTRSR